ncbi:hypothetical protein NE865_05505 [Phthorimaea operculella]|nr:hypothetical protein NE865_05505 [Phthorimaea operculella]
MASPRAILHGFYMSSCTWRVRAALHWKGIPFEEKPVDIVTKKDQLTNKFKQLNPAQKVPALVIERLAADPFKQLNPTQTVPALVIGKIAAIPGPMCELLFIGREFHLKRGRSTS